MGKTNILFGYQATLIYPDTIAHKAYYMARDYMIGNTRQEFRQASKHLMDKTIDILGSPPTTSNHTKPLHDLSHQAAKLTTVSAHLHQLHSHLNIHKFNYQLAINQAPQLGDIAIYHQQQQEKILFRLNEDLTHANATLNATNTALNYLRADYERQQTETTEQLRQDEKEHAAQEARADRRTQIIFAIVGIILGLGQIIDHNPNIMLWRAIVMGGVFVVALCSLWYYWDRI